MEGSNVPSNWRTGSNLTPSAAAWEPSKSSTGSVAPSQKLTPSAAEFKPRINSPQHVENRNVVPVSHADGSVTYVSQAGESQHNYMTQLNGQQDAMNFIKGPPLQASTLRPVPSRRTYAKSKILPDDVRRYFATQTKLLLKEIEPSNPLMNELPREFTVVNPLDDPGKKRGAAGSSGYPTSVYKAVNSNDGHAYCVRRIDNVRSRGLRDVCKQVVQLCSRVRHANVVPLRDAVVRRGALFLIHDYFPGAKTLNEFVLARGNGKPLQESEIWNMIIQLLTAVS